MESGSRSGAVTFLFTDIESSTRLWEQAPDRMRIALAHHDVLVRTAVEHNHGSVVKMIGDGVHAAFQDPFDAVRATLQLQQSLADPEATSGIALRVRCGLHLGVVEHRDNDFFGPVLNRAARIMSAAHGGQVLLSQAVIDLIGDRLPAQVSLRDLGTVRLRDLTSPEHVYQLMHPQLRQDFPALRSLEATPNNLPQQPTSFIGREKELQELKRLLSKSRLLTLTGSGGCGKTRLSLQVAVDAVERFPDGVWFVELASLADPVLLPKTIAVVLGLEEERNEPIVQTVTQHLKAKRLLLVLDNCEHLLESCAQLADALLRHSPQLTILATSREALAIAGEQTYRVPSLSLPDSQREQTVNSIAPFEAVQLFAERALLVRPDFELTGQNASAVASICRRLDGIPLAIELAAARVRFLSAEEVNRKLDQRFVLLTGGSRTALPRQQTLRSLIGWSYDLLGESEKLLLQRLSVFAGSWTLEAAEQVCTDQTVGQSELLDLLTSLADKSLVVVEQSSEASRYRLLETVRQYAREKLLENGSSDAFRRQHRSYFVALAEQAESELGGEPNEWLRRLEAEHDNLRSALESSLFEPDVEAGLRLCGALYRFWWMRGHVTEGRNWCARVLSKAGTRNQTLQRAKVLHVAGVLAYHQNDYPTARTLEDESLAISRQLHDRKGIAASLNNLGLLACDQGDFASARALYEESLRIKRQLGDRRGIANSLNNLGNIAYDQDDLARARALYEESLAVARELGDREGIARLLGNLGNVAIHEREFASAKVLHEESLAIKRELGHRQRIAGSLNSVGNLALDQGDFISAARLYKEALSIARELNDRLAIANSLEGLAAVIAALGDPGRAAQIWGAANHLREDVRLPLSPRDRPKYESRLAEARSAVGDNAAFDRAWKEGHAMAIEQAIQVALFGALA